MEDETTQRDAQTPVCTVEGLVAVEADAPRTPRPRRKSRKTPEALPEQEYAVRDANGTNVFVSKDFFAVTDRLKKEAPGFEMIRTSDGVRLAYNTRQKSISNISPLPFKKR